MCPECSFCGKYADSTSVEEGSFEEVGNALICYECMDDLAVSLGVPAMKDDIDELQTYIAELEGKIQKLERMIQ
jgi:hypothetical protein